MKSDGWRFILCLCAMLLAAGAVCAQEATAEGAPEEDLAGGDESVAMGDRTIEEITVTARKTEESLDTIPLTMRAFTADDIKQQRVESVMDIADLTPGLFISNYQGKRDEPGLQFRGMDVGTVARTNQNASSFVDGIYLPGSALFLPMENLQRTEVVKGPQSAFFGRATFGGAVNLIMKSPTFEWKGDASAVVGNNGRIDLNAGVGGPISDTLAFRVFGRYYDYDGGWDNSVPGSETLGAQSSFAGSASLSFQPNPSSNFELRVLYDEDDDGPGTNIFFPSSILNCGPFSQDGQTGTAMYYCGELTRDLANPVGYDTTTVDVPGSNWPKDDFGLEREFMLATFAFDIGLSDSVSLDSLTSYLMDETINVDDFTGDGQLLWWYHNDDTLFSQELRVSGTSEKIDWLVGGYYLNAEYEDLGNGFGCADPDALVFGFLPFCPFLGFTNARGYFEYNISPPLKIENTALFGSLTWRVSDSVSLSAEGRFARDSIDEGVIENLVDGTLVPLKEDFDSFSPRVILNWMASDDGMFYASIAQGNKPGDFNADFTRDVGTGCQDAFESMYGIGRTVPEAELVNYELGWKHNINRGRHRFNAAGYYMDWRDQQFRAFVNQVDTNCDGVVDENDEFQVDGLISAGKSEIIGAELFYNGWLGQYFNLMVSYNYNRTEYKEFEDSSYAAVFGSNDASGKEMPRSPKHAGNIGLTFRIPVGVGTWDFFARADGTYTGSSWNWAHNLAKTEDAFRVNLRAGVESNTWAFSAWVENATDNDAIIFSRRFTDFTTLQTGFWGGLSRPREYGATVRYRF